MRVQVHYTFPPREGESLHAGIVREARHDQRERVAIVRLNGSQEARERVAEEFEATVQASALMIAIDTLLRQGSIRTLFYPPTA